MKKYHICQLMSGALVLLFFCLSGYLATAQNATTAPNSKSQGARPDRSVADARQAAEAWRTDMAAFVKAVLDVAKDATIPREEPFTVGGLNGIKRAGTYMYGKGDAPVAVLTHGDGGIAGELATELSRRFPSATISWRGVVESAKVDDDRKRHIVTMPFPPYSGAVVIQPLTFWIPFEKLSRDRSPAAGKAFAFTGTLKAGQGEEFCRDPVEVIYWFSSSGQPARQFVIVSLADVAPATANNAK